MGIAINENILLVGDSGAGKTSLVQRLTNTSFDAIQKSTHSITKTALENGITIYDFAGEELEEKIREHLKLISPSVIILVVDPRKEDIENKIEYWQEKLALNNLCVNTPKFLASSRCDLYELPTYLTESLKKFAFNGIYQTSSQTGQGTQELRTAILNSIVFHDDQEENIASIIVREMIDKFCIAVAKNSNVLFDIEWRNMEIMIFQIFKSLGFNAQLTSFSKDGGKDVIIEYLAEKGKEVYYIEVKHWKVNRANDNSISAFVQVNARDATSGGLFLSSSGFTDSVHSRRAEFSSQKIRLGNKDKIVSLCTKYVQQQHGYWQPTTILPELLFEDTL